MSTLVVEAAGLRTLVQDLGRPGLAHLGLSAGGAWDRAAHAMANRLVGNDPSAATLEVMLGQFAVRAAGGPALVALAGAACPATVDGRPVDHLAPVVLPEGAVLRLGMPSHGIRTHLAVHGGIEATPSFGSRSSDPTRSIGPAVVRTGDELHTGDLGTGTLRSSDLSVTAGAGAGELVLRATWGPRDDWFSDAARRALTTRPWDVTDQSDRVGTRLAGTALERAVEGELQSEAVVRGSVQVPTSGQPLVFGPDHPTTGGYPVIVVVDGPDADLLAQARAGQVVRFDVRRPRLALG